MWKKLGSAPAAITFGGKDAKEGSPLGWRRFEEQWGGRKKKGTSEAEGRQRESIDRAADETAGVFGQMKGYDDRYLEQTKGANSAYGSGRDQVTGSYQQGRDQNIGTYQRERDAQLDGYSSQLKGFMDEAAAQGQDAEKTYRTDIQPRMRDIMDKAQSEADSAMTLKEAGDPNNAVNQAWRGMYEQQAQGVNRQALADVGVMSALGSQATATQLGGLGGAISGNQLLALQGQNMAQSGQAYARAQQQMQRLREQGLEVGRLESGAQYERGQRAKDRYAGSVGDYADADSRFQGQKAALRDERAGYEGQRFDLGDRRIRENFDIGQKRTSEDRDIGMRKAQDDYRMSQGVADLEHGLSSGQAGRTVQNIGQKYGQQVALDQGIAQANYARAGAGTNMLSGGLQAVGTAVGAKYGGPAGAAAGGEAGKTIGQGAGGNAQTQAPADQSYGAYGQGGGVYNYSQPYGQYQDPNQQRQPYPARY